MKKLFASIALTLCAVAANAEAFFTAPLEQKMPNVETPWVQTTDRAVFTKEPCTLKFVPKSEHERAIMGNLFSGNTKVYSYRVYRPDALPGDLVEGCYVALQPHHYSLPAIKARATGKATRGMLFVLFPDAEGNMNIGKFRYSPADIAMVSTTDYFGKEFKE